MHASEGLLGVAECGLYRHRELRLCVQLCVENCTTGCCVALARPPYVFVCSWLATKKLTQYTQTLTQR